MASFTWFHGNMVVRERGGEVRGERSISALETGPGKSTGGEGGHKFTVALLGHSAHTRSLDT